MPQQKTKYTGMFLQINAFSAETFLNRMLRHKEIRVTNIQIPIKIKWEILSRRLLWNSVKRRTRYNMLINSDMQHIQ